jgi:broad specificity phosphatase PhoE
MSPISDYVTLILARHLDTDPLPDSANPSYNNLVFGATHSKDSSISENNLQAFQEGRNFVCAYKVDAIYTGTHVRQKQSGSALKILQDSISGPTNNLSLSPSVSILGNTNTDVTETGNLDEQNLGDLAGKDVLELMTNSLYIESLQDLTRRPTTGAESGEEVLNRAKQFFLHVSTNDKGRLVVAYTSRGLILHTALKLMGYNCRDRDFSHFIAMFATMKPGNAIAMRLKFDTSNNLSYEFLSKTPMSLDEISHLDLGESHRRKLSQTAATGIVDSVKKKIK